VDALSAALTSASGAVAAVSLRQEQTHTAVGQHTLLHGEALFVVASSDAENVTLNRNLDD
jgi:hypothetical protein